MSDLSQVSYKSREIMDLRISIISTLNQLHPSDAISLIESIGKELRRKNSVRIMNNQPIKHIDMERPDLEIIKRKR